MKISKILLNMCMLCFFIFESSAAENNNALMKTRITFNIPLSVKLSIIESTLNHIADKYSDKFSEYKGIMPDEVPDTPAEALDTHSAATINFDSSLYAIRAYTYSTWFGNSYAQVYIVALYPYKDGYRLYLYTYFKTKNNLLGQIGGALLNSMSDISLDTGFIDTIHARDSILKEIPQIKLYRQSPEVLEEYRYDFDIHKIVKIAPTTLTTESTIKTESIVQIESNIEAMTKQESR